MPMTETGRGSTRDGLELFATRIVPGAHRPPRHCWCTVAVAPTCTNGSASSTVWPPGCRTPASLRCASTTALEGRAHRRHRFVVRRWRIRACERRATQTSITSFGAALAVARLQGAAARREVMMDRRQSRDEPLSGFATEDGLSPFPRSSISADLRVTCDRGAWRTHAGGIVRRLVKSCVQIRLSAWPMSNVGPSSGPNERSNPGLADQVQFVMSGSHVASASEPITAKSRPTIS